ncbi:MAG: excinuclease ABC subunit UvrC [Bowdeniella nasicola]|nr:excinuclease ABC subunit UvrC [Bowdeniella nasicola]
MADPSSYRPAPHHIPTSAGVYRFTSSEGQVLYVGKAKNLRNRLAQYFNDPSALSPRIRQMVYTAAGVQWTVVSSEIEALTLEYAWIKEFEPRYNVMYRDDKSYPYLAVTLAEEIPRVFVTREAKRRGTRYFGPYTKVWAVNESLDQLLRVFPVRTCRPGVFRRAKAAGRACLLGYIDKCSAPCIGRISPQAHRELIDELCRFMEGNTKTIMDQLRSDMEKAAADQAYERAAKLRDDLVALQTVSEKNTLVLPESVDADVYALATDELTAAVQVFYVRAGRIRGHRGWVIDRPANTSAAELIERLLVQMYGERAHITLRSRARSVDDVHHLAVEAIPPEILVSTAPSNAAAITGWLTKLRGAKVQVRVPKRGAKKTLLETVATNADAALKLHRTRRAGDLTARSAALEALQEGLELESAPLRIECFDVSHTQGTNQVASMVVFEDGAPRKRDYRQFIIRGKDGNGAADDTAAMAEVLTRRYRRLGDGEDNDEAAPSGLPSTVSSGQVDATSQPPQRFAYRPQLIVVDGGLPQVNAAARTLEDLGVSIPVIGLAKRLEEVWRPNEEFPVIFPRTSQALYLLQHVRDESHRFAITFHRKRRTQAMTRSVLDGIDGLGPVRQAALLRHFGSVKKIRQASIAELCNVEGIGENLARIIHDQLAKS